MGWGIRNEKWCFATLVEFKAQTEDDRLLILYKYNRQERKSALTYRVKHQVIGYEQVPTQLSRQLRVF